MPYDKVKHIVVLMMENRSFDHMLGAQKPKYPKINGLSGNETNPDTKGAIVKVRPPPSSKDRLRTIQITIFLGRPANLWRRPGRPRIANMQGFMQSYFRQANDDVNASHAIMNYFVPVSCRC